MNDLQLGRLLRMRRMRRGWRLRDVADACNLAVATVGRGELGAFAAWVRRSDYELVAEASFSTYGERGRIDLLAYGAATSTLIVVEAKTELSDLQDLGPASSRTAYVLH